MMDNNDYKKDTVSIIENAAIHVGEKINEIELNNNRPAQVFLKENYLYKKIRERDTEPHFKNLIGAMMVKISGFAGIKEGIADFDKRDIMKMMLGRYSDLTPEEIWKAFELERYGGYPKKSDHYQLFNANYVSDVMVKYRQWKHEMKMTYSIQPPRKTIELLAEITPEGKDQLLKSGIVAAFEAFKKTGTIESPFVHYFDFLLEHGYIKGWETPELLKYYQRVHVRAEQQLTEEYAEKTSAQKSERIQIKEDYAKILNGTSPKIEVRKKLIILTEYFTKHHLAGNDLKIILS